MTGKTISHYKILEKLGAGGMGVVYKAEDTLLERTLALKFLPADWTRDEDAKARFLHEARAASRLDHPNICTVYEINETDDGQLFIAMAYYDGESLAQKIVGATGRSPMPIDKVLNIAIQIAQGLQRAHEAGIIHRDIKPANIMITDRNEVKIVDFGLAKAAGRTQLTKEGSTLGTVAHMSPEQVHGEPTDRRTDIWALGVVLYEMLTGKLPFDAAYDQAIMYRITNEEPEPITGLRTGVPMELEQVVSKCLEKDAAKRYQHVDEVLVDLRRVSEISGTKRTVLQPIGTARLLKRNAAMRYGVAGFFGLLAVSAGIYFLQKGSRENPVRSTQSQRTATDIQNQWQNSIAVLPFKNISPDPEQEYFCDGMTEQIITNLSQLQALKVIARTSVMKFKDTEKTIPEIAEELHVEHVLEGSIRKAGNKIRVTAQLIQADGGHHLWAHDYDRELKDIFAVQDDVSQAIAKALFKELNATEAEEVKTEGTENAEAYEYYLKGSYFNRKFGLTFDLENFKKAESMFKKAIELDPQYAFAFAGLADAYGIYFDYVSNEQKYRDLSQKYIGRAFQLAPNSAQINAVKGWLEGNDYASYKRALEINPNHSLANAQMGVFLGLRGLHEQAVKYFAKASELDPLDPTNYMFLGWVHRLSGRFDPAISDYQKALDFEADQVLALSGFARVLIQLKRYDEAEEILSKSEKINPDNPYNKTAHAWLSAVKGKKEEALKLLDETHESKRYHTIVVYSLLGLKDEAIKLLDNKPVAQLGSMAGDYLDMLHNPVFDILRDTEPFKAALQKAKEEYEANLIKYSEVFL